MTNFPENLTRSPLIELSLPGEKSRFPTEHGRGILDFASNYKLDAPEIPATPDFLRT
jgi:hypothetical protein